MGIRRIGWQALAGAFVTLVLASAVSKADMVHRYSFTSDASDSVGGANGTLIGGATVSGGQLRLNNPPAGMPATDWVELPIGGTIARLTSVTFEAWVTWTPDPVPTFWARIFDFGNSTAENMFLTPLNGNNRRVRFAVTIDGGGDEEQTTSAIRFPIGLETHVAVTIDDATGMTILYLNGQPVAIEFGTTLRPSDLGSSTNNYLGKSQYNDPGYIGSINEFRIYDTALTPDDIMASFLAGPDA
jgi:hypothetical protein